MFFFFEGPYYVTGIQARVRDPRVAFGDSISGLELTYYLNSCRDVISDSGGQIRVRITCSQA